MDLIYQLTIIIALATVLGFLARLLKQPLIVAYIAAGALLSNAGFFTSQNQETFHLFADLGIMFLLFLVGMEINLPSLKLVGRSSIIVGLCQIVFTTLIGFPIALALHFNALQSIYIAVMLTFSSTIIIIKLLSDKKDTNSLYGKISIGFLLIQDLVAILILIILGSLQNVSTFQLLPIVISILKGIGLFAIILLLGYKIIPKVFEYFGHSQEILFLASTAWVFGIVSVVSKLGFSVEIAGFLAGLALANSSEHYQIATKIKPLRDFFVLVFFILLGSYFALSGMQGLGWPIIVFSLFVLIGNPLIVLIIMGLMGYRKRTSFMAGVTVAQVSEFSLIVAAMGLRLGHINQEVVSLITVVAIITITISTYMIVCADQLFRFFRTILGIFEKKKTTEITLPEEKFEKKVVLVGFHRTGKSLAHNLSPEDLLVIDFDPDIIHSLANAGHSFLFGDITDPDIFEKAISRKTKLIISTSPGLFDNLGLLEMMKKTHRKIQVITRAETEREADMLYAAGAHYVMLPNLAAGHHLGSYLAKNFKPKDLDKLKAKDYAILEH